MPKWDGIEDVSPKPYIVWLWRVKESDNWKPLRRVDCRALNESPESKVFIEGGRATADKANGVIKNNFHRATDRMLASALWFVRKDANSKDQERNLVPILNEEDANKIENLYQLAIEASSSFGKGIEELEKEQVELSDKSLVVVVKSGGGDVLSIRKKSQGWLSSSQDLQRGYGRYTVDGEDTELMLGPLRHLFFVIHGIGEALWSRDDNSTLSLIQEVNRMRIKTQNRQIEQWKKQCEKANWDHTPLPPMPDRIEFIPIEWFEQIHSSSSALSRSLKAATLPTVPALRDIANEAIFDVLLYITPNFCGPVLECVISQITKAYDKFLEVHPDFIKNGGKISIIGHSLGSLIGWDILSLEKDAQMEPKKRQSFGGNVGKDETGGVAIASDDPNNVDVGYQAYVEKNADTEKNGTWGPTLPSRLDKRLPFVPEHAIFLGSPLGLFLTMRGAHPVFDYLRKKQAKEVRKEKQSGGQDGTTSTPEKTSSDDDPQKEVPYASPFTLPINGGLYNIFHPSDPVAYRIEPLLLPTDMEIDDIPAPIHLTVPGQDVRLHIKVEQLGDGFSSFFSKLGKTPSTKDLLPADGPIVFPLGGKSERVDFQLQKGFVDNEYVSAVTSHSGYFNNSDVVDFVTNLSYLDQATTTTETKDK